MARNSDLKTTLERVRRRFPRSAHGKVLGVFRGIAESLGFSVCWTRVVGVLALLSAAGFFGAEKFITHLLVGAFFYLLLALLMRPPRPDGSPDPRLDEVRGEVRPSFERRGTRPAAVPYQRAARVPQVDLAELDRQADRLNQRIQRMETVVTDRQFDWDRKMER